MTYIILSMSAVEKLIRELMTSRLDCSALLGGFPASLVKKMEQLVTRTTTLAWFYLHYISCLLKILQIFLYIC